MDAITRNYDLVVLFRSSKKHFVDKVGQAIEAEDGNVAGTARRLDVSKSTLVRWLDRVPELAERLAQVRLEAAQRRIAERMEK